MNRKQLARRNKTFIPALRPFVDGTDPFMSGNQIKKPLTRASHSERLERI
jgi:hypothetical protein